MDDSSNSRLSRTRSPPRQRRHTTSMQGPPSKDFLDQDFDDSARSESYVSRLQKDGFVEKPLEPLHHLDKPAFHPSLRADKPALKRPVKRKSAPPKLKRRSVSFSDVLGTIPPPPDLPSEEEAEKEEESITDTDKQDDSQKSDDSKTDTATPTTTTTTTPTTKEKFTPQERKARRESALKEAKLAAKNVKKQNRSNRKLLGATTTADDPKTTTKSKGFLGGLFSRGKSKTTEEGPESNFKTTKGRRATMKPETRKGADC